MQLKEDERLIQQIVPLSKDGILIFPKSVSKKLSLFDFNNVKLIINGDHVEDTMCGAYLYGHGVLQCP